MRFNLPVKLRGTSGLTMFFIALLLMLSANTLAQKKDSVEIYDMSLEELMQIEVTTATKTSAKIDEVPSIIDVITGEQIKQRGYQNLAQVLNDIANNHEDRANWGIGEPLNQNVGFGFRFDTGQNILMLFNGQRLNAFLPGNRFGGEEYLLSNIERIEIVRGPGSALYGSNAFTAVVNVITKHVSDKQGDLFDVSTQYIPTSKGFTLGSTLLTGVGKGSISSSFRYLTEKGQNLKIQNSLFGNQTIRDGVDQAIDGEVVYKLGELNIFTKFTKQKRNTFTGFNGVNPSDMEDLKLSMYGYSAGANYNLKTGQKTSIKFSGGWHQDNWTEISLIPIFQVNSDGTQLILDSGGNPILDNVNLYRNGEDINTSFFMDGQGADTRSIDGEIQFTWNYLKKNNIVAGVYMSDDKILNAYRPTELNLIPLQFVPFRTIRDQANNWLFDLSPSRRTVATYAQGDYHITSNFLFSAGARLDLYSGTGVLKEQKYSEFNPRFGFTYLTEGAGSFKVLYGKATRVPNGFETLSSVSILGNPANTAERISTLQIQWTNNWNSFVRTELGGFNSSISNRLETNANLSDELLAQGYIGQFVNVGNNLKQRNNGIDGKIVVKSGRITANMNFTQYFGSDDGRGNAIAYIPNTMVNMDFNISADWLNINFGFNYRGGFKQPASDLRNPVKDYLIGRLNLIASPSSHLSFRLTGKNIFNTQYQYPSSSQSFINHFPARGIELMGGATYSF
jgi:outer membrane receptor protein involved in Fe transport